VTRKTHINYHLVPVESPFIRKTIDCICTKQNLWRELPSVTPYAQLTKSVGCCD